MRDRGPESAIARYAKDYFDDTDLPLDKVGDLAKSSFNLRVLTGETLPDGNKQYIPIGLTLNPDSRGVIIQEGGFMHGINTELPTDPAFRAAIAYRTGHSVMTFGLPGVEASVFQPKHEGIANKLTPEQYKALIAGNAQPTANAIAFAVQNVLSDPAYNMLDNEVHAIMPSLTTFIGPAFTVASLRQDIDLKSMTLLEPVALEQKKNLLGLGANFARSMGNLGTYLDLNHETYREAARNEAGMIPVGALARQAVFSGLTYARGLSQGRALQPLLTRESRQLTEANETEIHLITGLESEFATSHMVDMAARALWESGFRKNVTTTSWEDTAHGAGSSSRAFSRGLETLQV